MLRQQFYLQMEREGIQPILSFFPLAIRGIKEFGQSFSKKDLNSAVHMPTIRYFHSKLKNPIFCAYNRAIPEVAKNLGIVAIPVDISMEEVFRQSEPNLPTYSLDISMRYTRISISDPKADIKFMFLSKEGIRLPDTDGRIFEELNKEDFDPQVINALLWEQAVVWPVGHFTSGLWAKDYLDFSELNTALPQTDLQWIGSKF